MGNERFCESDYSNTDQGVLVILALTNLKGSIEDLIEIEKMLRKVDKADIDVGELASISNDAQKFLEDIADELDMDIDSWRDY